MNTSPAVNYSELTGRELLIEVELRPSVEARQAFTEAIFSGKLSGMTQNCVRLIREQARKSVTPVPMAQAAEAFRIMDDDVFVAYHTGRITADQAIRITIAR